MTMFFADTLKKLRAEKGLSQNEIAKRMYVTKVTVSRWENGNRLPDAAMIYRLSEVLGVDINVLFSAAAQSDESPNVILVDDNKIILECHSHRLYKTVGSYRILKGKPYCTCFP